MTLSEFKAMFSHWTLSDEDWEIEFAYVTALAVVMGHSVRKEAQAYLEHCAQYEA